MFWLKSKGYSTITLNQISEGLQHLPKEIKRPFILTFDDGYQSVLDHALPVLKELNFQSIIFIVTDYVGKNSYFFERQGGPPYLHASWEELNEASTQGFSIGAHTHTHADLTRTESDIAQVEIKKSKDLIINHLGNCDHFAYPYGCVNGEVKSWVEEIGFKTAVTTASGMNTNIASLHLLNRFTIGSKTTLRRLKRKLGHWF